MVGRGPVVIPLPGSTGGTDEVLAAELGEWLGSSAMRDLAAASGWDWPGGASVGELARELAALSVDWDFRGRHAARAGGGFHERSGVPEERERVFDEGRVKKAAAALGLVETGELDFVPTHVVVLSGTARANVNRARWAAEVVRETDPRPVVVGLAAHRELGEGELKDVAGLGLSETDTEWTTMRDALAGAFGLGMPGLVWESGPDTGGRAARSGRSAEYRWDEGAAQLFVVPAANPDDERPRADTRRQIEWWSAAPGRLSRDSRLLLVTTQIYAPYQQLVAVRVLRRTVPGCRVRTMGVARDFTGQQYLQEVRSALLAAADLAGELPAAFPP